MHVGAGIGRKSLTIGMETAGAAPDPFASVTKDATSSKYVPASAAEWTTLLAGTGIPNPTSAWNLDETSGPFVDMFGVDNLSGGAPAATQQSFAGWSRVGITTVETAVQSVSTANTLTGASRTLLTFVGLSAVPAAQRLTAYLGDFAAVAVDSSGNYGCGNFLGVNSGSAAAGTTVHPTLYKVDNTAVVNKLYTDQEAIVGTALGSDPNQTFIGCVFSAGAPSAWYGYAAEWTGSNAELTDAQARTLLQRLGWTVAW